MLQNLKPKPSTVVKNLQQNQVPWYKTYTVQIKPGTVVQNLHCTAKTRYGDTKHKVIENKPEH